MANCTAVTVGGVGVSVGIGVGKGNFSVDGIIWLALVWATGANRGPADTATPDTGSILTTVAANVPLRLRRLRRLGRVGRDRFGGPRPLSDGMGSGMRALPVFVVAACVLASVSVHVLWWRWRGTF